MHNARKSGFSALTRTDKQHDRRALESDGNSLLESLSLDHE